MLNRNEVAKLNDMMINESFQKIGDNYRGNVIIDIPKSLVNSIRSKAKKELNIDTTENYSDIAICDLIMQYISTTYINKESIPVSNLFGVEAVSAENTEVSTDPVDDNINTSPIPNEPENNTMEPLSTEINDDNDEISGSDEIE